MHFIAFSCIFTIRYFHGLHSGLQISRTYHSASRVSDGVQVSHCIELVHILYVGIISFKIIASPVLNIG